MIKFTKFKFQISDKTREPKISQKAKQPKAKAKKKDFPC